MPAENTASDTLVLSLFEGAGPVETPTPGVRAWLGNDTSSTEKRHVLIKRVNGSSGKGRATEALALLHPQIVRTRRWIVEGGNLYIVRDVVRGKNLKQLLASPTGTRPGPELLRRLLMPVLDAVEFAHGQGVAHGGISPENVLVGEGISLWLSDFATADPNAPHHVAAYQGNATVPGDIKALGRMISGYLPTTGPFASAVVRSRLEGLITRCDTISDLREALLALEKLAAAPSPAGAPPPPKPAPPTAAPAATSIPTLRPAGETPPAPWEHARYGKPFPNTEPAQQGTPVLLCQLAEPPLRLPQGSGGAMSLIVRNEGNAPLVVRMIATQHAWLNVRPMELPITIPAGQSERVVFLLSVMRLTPGEYRSEVYLSTNAGGKGAEDLRGGWYKHTCEVRVTVESPGKSSPLRSR